MAPSRLRSVIGAVKDKTSIGLAKVNNSASIADLEIAIVRATSHEEYPPEERYIREILCLTCYTRHFVGACVSTLARRLNKTRNWVVALKVLVVVQRLLEDGDPAYEQEIFFATRRGTRFLNLSDFRDSSMTDSWDYSAFVRTYAMYLDEMLEFKMQGKRRKRGNGSCAYEYERSEEEEEVEDEEEKEEEEERKREKAEMDRRMISRDHTPAREMEFAKLLSKTHQLQQLLEKFLATRPTGKAKQNRVVLVALYPVVKESFYVYYDITDVLGIFVDKFMELDIPDCVKVHDIFCRSSKQFDELDSFYIWCKEVGVSRPSDYPEVERISPKKLELMDEFIRDKCANRHYERIANQAEDELELEVEEAQDVDEDQADVDDPNQIKALPAPEEKEVEEEPKPKEDQEEKNPSQQEVGDLLNLGDDAITSEDHGDQLALALFNGEIAKVPDGPGLPPGVSVWDAFKDPNTDWETALIESASYLPHQKATLGGGFDSTLLDGLYLQGAANATTSLATPSGSASSMAFGSAGNQAPPQMLALPAPPSARDDKKGGRAAATMSLTEVDPFAASAGVAPPPYVQMSDMEKKRMLLVEEQMMWWKQYACDGMQPSNFGMTHYHNQMGGYGYNNPHGSYRY